jgi:tRNA threonylcarbamoyladenosine biosynthesis protein TsaB
MKKLHIDTSSNEQVTLALHIGSEVTNRVIPTPSRRNQALLVHIKALLEEMNISFSELTEISVAAGPGSFTGVRVGVSIANTLGTVLQIPINSKEVGKLVEPIYE